MSLFKQIALLLALFIATALGVVFYLNFKTANTFVQDQLDSDAQDTATSLGLSISMVAAEPDALPRIETMVDAIFDSGYYQSIVLEDASGNVLIEKQNPRVVKSVPQWFIDAVVLNEAVGSSRIMAGWTQFGTIYVHNHNGHAYYQLWNILEGLAGWFSLLVALLFGVLYLLLKLVFKPVVKVQQQAEAILENRFITTDEIPFTTELRGVTKAMNTTVERIRDIFQREAAAIKNYHDLLYTDQELHIPNRKFFITTLQSRIDTTDQHSFGAVALLSIDNFETMKSRFGYHEFSAFLSEMLDLLGHEGDECVVARMNANDFALMLPGLHQKEALDALGERITQSARRIASAHFGNDAAALSIHVGLAPYEPGQNIATILSHVDHALMQAKMEPPFSSSTFDFHEGSSEFRSHGKEELIALMHEAIEHGHIQMAFQRCVDTATQTTFHYELYARFHTAEGELIPARHLLPVAHSAGLLDVIDRHLLRRACSASTACAMNLSAPTFASNAFMLELETLLQQASEPKPMHFETTLSIARNDPDAVERYRTFFAKHGFAFGIDGFVFSEEEVHLLEQLRPDYIKIGADYLESLIGTEKTPGMFNSLHNLTSAVGTRIIASNVEDAEQQQRLEARGITLMQGFYIHKPEILQI